MLTVTHISKSYNSTQILHDVSFTAESGSITILLGGSGTGKSTILRILNDLEQADNGTITLNDMHIDPTQEHKTRRIGMVFQAFHVFRNMSVLGNITFTLKTACNMDAEQAEAYAYRLLSEYQLADRANTCARSLSGGQQQRLAIARTVATRPDVICLDEPTSALDPTLTDHVAQVICKLRDAGYTVIVATHDTQLLQHLTGTIHLLKNGSIVATAAANTVFNYPETTPKIAAFLGIETAY